METLEQGIYVIDSVHCNSKTVLSSDLVKLVLMNRLNIFRYILKAMKKSNLCGVLSHNM